MPRRQTPTRARRRHGVEKRRRAAPTTPPGAEVPNSPSRGAPGILGTETTSARPTAKVVTRPSYVESGRKWYKVALQLHRHEGYYYRKWRAAMRKAFSGRRGKG